MGIWVADPTSVASDTHRFSCEPRSCDWYRVVDAFAGIDSEDAHLQMRFECLYGELLSSVAPAPENPKKFRCQVRVGDGEPALVTLDTGEELDIVDFVLAVFPDRGYVEMHQAAPGWRSIGLERRERPLLTARGGVALVDTREAWQPLVASCVMNWAMRMQTELLFFHAASVGIEGVGVLLTGNKGAGKTTLSMALAASGHAFLGDEIAAIRPQTRELAPFRRAISVRAGPCSPLVRRLLRAKSCATERFPDGTTRTRVRADELFPESTEASVPIHSIFFLSGFEDQARAEPFGPGTADLRLLTPLPCVFWGSSPARPMMQVAKLLSQVKCYRLYAGSPQETAGLIERIVRTS